MISSRNFDNLPSIGLLITYPKSNAPEGIYMSLIDTFHYFKWPNFDWTPLNSPEVSSFGSDKHSWMKFLTQEGSNAGKHRRRKHFGGDLTIAGADITVCRPSKGPLEKSTERGRVWSVPGCVWTRPGSPDSHANGSLWCWAGLPVTASYTG